MAKSARTTSSDHTESGDNQAERFIQSEGQAAWRERQRMIAEAAYFRALNRGFQGGDPIDDWIAAEVEIGVSLPGSESGESKRESS
jgi:hypothetical protein